MARYILDVNELAGVTVVLIEHDMGVVMDISHRVTVLDFGQVIADGEPAAGRERPSGDRRLSRRGARPAMSRCRDDVPQAPRRARPSATATAGSRCRRSATGSGSRSPGPQYHAPGARLRPRPGRARLRARRRGRRPRRQPAGVAHRRAGRAVRSAALSVGIYPDERAARRSDHVLDHGQVRIVVAEDQEQVDKLIALQDPAARNGRARSSTTTPAGSSSTNAPSCSSSTTSRPTGEELERARPGWLDAADRRRARPHDIAIICTTSGTTGKPKLAMLSHANLLAMGQSLMAVDPIEPDDRYVCFLPLAWIGEQMLAVACGLQAGFTLSFAEDAATQRADLREIGPRRDVQPAADLGVACSPRSRSASTRPAGSSARSSAGLQPIGRPRGRPATARATRSASRCGLAHRLADVPRPCARCATSSASRASAAATPAARRVGRTSSASSTRSASTSSRSTGRPRSAASPSRTATTTSGSTPSASRSRAPSLRSPTTARSCCARRPCSSGYLRDEAATAEAATARRLAAHRRRRLPRRGRPPRRDRPRQGRARAAGRHRSSARRSSRTSSSSRPYVEEAVVFRGGDGLTSPRSSPSTRRPSGPGPSAAARLHDLHRPRAASRGRRAGRRGGRPGQRRPARQRAGPALRAAAQAARPDDDEITRTRKVRRGRSTTRYADIIAALDGEERQRSTSRASSPTRTARNVEREITLRIQSTERLAPLAGRRASCAGGRR